VVWLSKIQTLILRSPKLVDDCLGKAVLGWKSLSPGERKSASLASPEEAQWNSWAGDVITVISLHRVFLSKSDLMKQAK
jgi:hypothetical protein